MPTERNGSSGEMDKHQGRVNAQYDSQTMLRDGHVSATIEYVSGDGTNEEFGAKEGEVAVLQKARHQRVSFSGDVEANPEHRQLCVEPV